MSSITLDTHKPFPRKRIERRLTIIGALVILADWLFYGQSIGLSLSIFILVLGIAIPLANPRHVSARRITAGAVLLLLSVLPLIENFALLPCLFGVFGIAVFAASMMTNSSTDALIAAVRLLLLGPFQVLVDVARAGKIFRRRQLAILPTGLFIAWLIPIAFGAIFVALFASANPIIEGWLSHINIVAILEGISVPRLLFWLATISILWPFTFMRRRGKRAEAPAVSTAVVVAAPSRFFGAAAILRSLVLFNVIFAIQTAMDMIYLWGGRALPDGMTHAAYAHRGAYPLIVAALLAGGFVTSAMKPGDSIESLPLIRRLIYIWIGQTVLLVLSSILRLDLYVESYSLTYLRTAAAIWMAIVGFGLILIVARIALNRSNAWLVGANLAMLTMVLYCSCFPNFPFIIARFNLAHCKEVTGTGVALDEAYLVSLGPEIIPAMDSYRNLTHLFDRQRLAGSLQAEMMGWRSWSFRGWRLMRYLDNAPASTIPRAG